MTSKDASISSATTAPPDLLTPTQRRWRLLLWLLVAVISYLALTPQPPHEVSLGWDKLNHGSAFLVLAFVGAQIRRPTVRHLITLALALLAFGGAIEIIQSFVPGRSAEWLDLLADAVGATLGLLLAMGQARWRSSTQA
jgi:VanZ family protein